MKYKPYTEISTPDGPAYRLDPEFKKAWIEALLSGDYTQGNGWLWHADGLDGKGSYCCLGVACEIVDLPVRKIDGFMAVYPPDMSATAWSSSSYIQEEHKLIPMSVQKELAQFNDGTSTIDPMPFDLIAGFIQENL